MLPYGSDIPSDRAEVGITGLSDGSIPASSCYGGCVYITATGGTVRLPSAKTGMILYVINDSGGNSTLAVQSGEYLDRTLNDTDDLHSGGSHPLLHTVICPADGRWFLSHH